jgi:hypothetical protein
VTICGLRPDTANNTRRGQSPAERGKEARLSAATENEEGIEETPETMWRGVIWPSLCESAPLRSWIASLHRSKDEKNNSKKSELLTQVNRAIQPFLP